MRVFETQVPGVGRRYTLRFPAGGEFVVLLRNDGGRKTYWRENQSVDGDALFEVSESESRKIAEIFDGTYFAPVEDGLREALHDARVRWVEVDDDSPLANRTIRETGIRSRTGVSILAIQRGERTLSTPSPDAEIRPGDVVVVVGTDEAYREFDSYLSGDGHASPT
ncbi:cation:proton antiporter regulatory subunit [Halogeometricum limi]|uniref:Potassium/proton antiporter regulatory subunit, CPA2 family n=1 Tax=Halogeometricum limi TaxID=555875 RepID=A0A1I6FR22_9EURY|nr:TrkA C-terminal domain-containing protein [Halogeometricum limi]SFR32237.1 potassium/proton antiporter regulatory subunit, CPA2 family [Halogeometricum limi]